MDKLNENWSSAGISDLKMRIGINFGPAVVGNFGNSKRSDYSAIGPNVNLASRIESACIPGKVFISGDLCEFLSEEEFELAGEYELKGMDSALILYKLR